MQKAIIRILTVMSLIVLFTANLPTVSLAADGTAAFRATNFTVTVKPEYDDPRTLVIYQADLYATGKDTVKKGTPVTFIIPKGAQIGMACEINAQGGHDCQPYSSKDLDNDKVELSWKSSKDVPAGQKYPVYLEFYYDNKAVAPNKNFIFNFNPTFSMDSLAISFTQPKTATNFQLDPAASSSSQDQDGLTTYFENYSNKTPKDSIAIKVSYNKADNKPTFDKPQVGSQSSNNSNTTGSGADWLKNPAVLVPLIVFAAVMAFLIAYAVKNPKQPGNGGGTSNNFRAVKNNKNSKNVSYRKNAKSSGSDERRKLRQALLDGKISEATYKELIAELDD